MVLLEAPDSAGGVGAARGVARSALTPLAVLKLPVVLLRSALTPLAVLLEPVVLLRSALTPLAVLRLPVVLLKSAWTPLAVLSLPVVLLKSALTPLAVFSLPVVLLKSAWTPLAVLKSPVVLLKSAKFDSEWLVLRARPMVLFCKSAPVPRLVLSCCAAATPARESENMSTAITTDKNEAVLVE